MKNLIKVFWIIAIIAIIGFLAACKNGDDGGGGGGGGTPTHIHQWGEWTETTPASYISTGVETRICKLDSSHKETRISNPKPITTTAEWNAATTAIKNGGNDKTYDINVTGNFSIPGYSSNTFGDVTGITVNIKGAGTITLAAGSTGRLLYIGSNQTISLKDTHLVGHSSNNTSLVYVEGYNSGSKGTFNMTGGTISGNTAPSGSGVYVYYYGTFNMSGGTISNNISTENSFTRGGGGVFVYGYGTFNMSGTAVIRDNKAIRGGGVFLFLYGDTTFNMTGGTISGNTSTEYGCGIGSGYNSSAKNGRIYINITDGIITGNTAEVGGGIYAHELCTINLLSLNLVIGNTCTDTYDPVHQIWADSVGQVFINGVKQAPRKDGNYEWN